MRITIDIDTSTITGDDRRVLMALAGHDVGELRITHVDEPAAPPATPAPPLPVPVPAAFASKLGEAVAQFSPRGIGSEARLPFAQQAGVRTSSTMPDDEPADVVDAGAVLDGEPAEVLDAGAVPDVVRARGGLTVPRDLVDDDGEPRRIEDVTRAAILGVVEQPPVRHTSP